MFKRYVIGFLSLVLFSVIIFIGAYVAAFVVCWLAPLKTAILMAIIGVVILISMH